ncbi:hypothetical protein Pmani_006643 [Petrolisthes manimaculis]|uniref:MaoC-like domain-containing protein n=1 Tax=Petrolisthes manimaculis TaxID=1843537 RepID=A0AAE1QC61_9EUCA|nr:hypothetical protein Pmani_006643 [Petrolisthes manimaculis]
MFTSQALLERRSGKKGVDRPQYLKELLEEFNNTDQPEVKCQVLANLANFAYDPINYPWLRQLKVIDVFLTQVSEGSTDLCHFATAGLCNLALDKENKAYINKSGGVAIVSECLNSQHPDIVAAALTTLMFLVTPQSKPEITNNSVVRQMVTLTTSDDPRIRNLANIFLVDYCTSEQVLEAKKSTLLVIRVRCQVRQLCTTPITNVSYKEGDVATVQRTITQKEVEEFARLTGDWNPIHTDTASAKSRFEQCIVHGALLNGVVSGVIGTRLPGPGTVVARQELYFPNPCYTGEELLVTVKLASLRKLSTIQFSCTTTDKGKVVLRGSAKLILPNLHEYNLNTDG